MGMGTVNDEERKGCQNEGSDDCTLWVFHICKV
jgi:hypothetical protein